VRDYARASKGSLLAVVQAALLTVLHRYTGQEDLAIGSVFSGRTRAEVEPLVGFFANTVVLRTDLGGEPSFAELVKRCHETILNATAHQDVPLGLIVDALQPERVAGRNPLFQIGLTLQPADYRPALALGAVRAEPVMIHGGNSRFDFDFDIFDTMDFMNLKLEYSTELFDGERMERLLDHLLAALANGLAAPDTPVGEIDIAWNDTASGTRNGKLDSAGLPVPASRTVQYVAPRTASERWLAAAWQELLGVEQVGAEDNFFDLGGSSLLGMQLIARIRDRLGIELDPWHILTSQVLEQLAVQLDQPEPAPAKK
jgi:non-ribosomal peptide synthetase component F